MLLTFIALACVAVLAIAVSAALCLRRHAKQREKERLAALGPEGAADTTFEYQVGPEGCGSPWDAGPRGMRRCRVSALLRVHGAAPWWHSGRGTGLLLPPQELCRQHMAAKSLFGRADTPAAPAETSRVSSVSSQFSDAPQPSPSSHSSTPSWCEEPVQSNMDISTGHMILVSQPGGREPAPSPALPLLLSCWADCHPSAPGLHGGPPPQPGPAGQGVAGALCLPS